MPIDPSRSQPHAWGEVCEVGVAFDTVRILRPPYSVQLEEIHAWAKRGEKKYDRYAYIDDEVLCRAISAAG